MELSAAKAGLSRPDSKSRPIFHVFLSGAYGREHLLQSAYLARSLRLPLAVYVPQTPEFVMYCSRTVVTVRVDPSYLQGMDTAELRVCGLLRPFGVEFDFFSPTTFTGGSLPDIPEAWSVMTCPRLVSSMPGWWPLRHIGPNPRRIIKHVRFPVFIPCSVALAWKSVSVFTDDTPAGVAATGIGVEIARRAQLPLTTYGMLGRKKHVDGGTSTVVWESIPRLQKTDFHSGESRLVTRGDALYGLPRDSLVVVGFGAGPVRRTLRRQESSGRMTDRLPNPVLVVGRNSRAFRFADGRPHT